MHEAGIAQGLLDAAVNALPPGKPCRITRVVVTAGVLSGVEEESLSLYWTALTKDTPAEGSALQLKTTPARLVCRKCASSIEYDGASPVEIECCKCGGLNGLEGGRDEIILESLDVEIDDEDRCRQGGALGE